MSEASPHFVLLSDSFGMQRWCAAGAADQPTYLGASCRNVGHAEIRIILYYFPDSPNVRVRPEARSCFSPGPGNGIRRPSKNPASHIQQSETNDISSPF